MSLIWIDGFDHYGDESTLLDGAYAEQVNCAISTSEVRTGTYALRVLTRLRKTFNSVDTIGVGIAFYLTELPLSGTNEFILFRDASGGRQCSLRITASGAMEVHRGNASGSTLLATTTDPVVTPAAWYHVEIKFKVDDTTGAFEVRLNGDTILNETGVDTQFTSNAETSMVTLVNVAASGLTYFDDFYIWDTNGSYNNDFIGDARVYMLFPNGVTAQADWVANTGNPEDACDEVPPDDDTTYVEAVDPGDISVYELENLPANITTVHGLMTASRLKKTDSGDCDVQVSILNNGSNSDGTERPITTEYTYWFDVFEEDPDQAAAWTPNAVDAAQIRVNRTT